MLRSHAALGLGLDKDRRFFVQTVYIRGRFLQRKASKVLMYKSVPIRAEFEERLNRFFKPSLTSNSIYHVFFELIAK